MELISGTTLVAHAVFLGTIYSCTAGECVN